MLANLILFWAQYWLRGLAKITFLQRGICYFVTDVTVYLFIYSNIHLLYNIRDHYVRIKG